MNHIVHWTPEMDATLIAMHGANVGLLTIAERIGVGRSTCIRRIAKLGLPARNHPISGEPQPDLLADVEAFIAATGLSATKLGIAAVGDPRLVGELRKGRVARADVATRVRAFIASYPAEGA